MPLHRTPRTLLTGTTIAALLCLGSWPATGAQAAPTTWHFSAGTLIEVRSACRDGVRVGLAVVGSQKANADYVTRIVGSIPAPVSWTSTTPRIVDYPVTLAPLAAPKIVVVGDDPANEQSVTHLGTFTVPATRLMPLTTMALTGNREIEQSTPTPARVTDCRLFAPIDIVPGRSSNPVKVRSGDIQVAVLGTASMRGDRLTASRFRFGPSNAHVVRSVRRDVNHDRRVDLLLTFHARDTGLTCRSTRATVTGATPSGGRLEGSGRVTPVGC